MIPDRGTSGSRLSDASDLLFNSGMVTFAEVKTIRE